MPATEGQPLKPISPEAMAALAESRDWMHAGAGGDPLLRRDGTRAELETRNKRIAGLLQGTSAQPLLDKMDQLRQAMKQASDNYNDAEVQRLMREVNVLDDQFQKLMGQAGMTNAPAAIANTADLKARLGAAEKIMSFTERDAALAIVARDAAKAGDAALARQALGKMTAFPSRDKATLETARALLKNDRRAEAIEIARTITSFTQRDAALKELAQ